MRSRLIGITLFVLAVAITTLGAQAPAPAAPAAPAGRGQGRAAQPPRPKRAVIVTGENSFNGHVWKETSAELKSILDAGKDFAEVVIQPDPNYIANEEFLTFDVAIFDFRNQNPLPQQEKVEANLLRFLNTANKGLVTIHWANGAFPYWPEYNNIVGGGQLSVHDPRGPFGVKIVNPLHPATKDMKDYEADDELYWDLKMGNRPIAPRATAHSKVRYADFPVAWDLHYSRSRVFVTSLGHDVRALKVPGTAELIKRGAAWAGWILR